jgi:hypothetical protein
MLFKYISAHLVLAVIALLAGVYIYRSFPTAFQWLPALP